jgi:hypothetical protein
MNQEPGPLVVELYLEGARAIGICRQVQERRRLIDILNTQDAILEMEEASVLIQGAREPHQYPTLAVIKQTIIAAVPRETQDQTRLRAVFTMMGKQATTQQHVSLVVPPLRVEGTAHLSMSAGATVNLTERMSKFFPITGATMAANHEEERQLDVILVSRDHVVGTSVLPASRYATAV